MDKQKVYEEELKVARKKMSEAKTEEEVKKVIQEWGTALYRIFKTPEEMKKKVGIGDEIPFKEIK